MAPLRFWMILIEPQPGGSIAERIPKWCSCTVKKGPLHAFQDEDAQVMRSLLWNYLIPRSPFLRNSHSKQDRFVLPFFLLKFLSLANDAWEESYQTFILNILNFCRLRRTSNPPKDIGAGLSTTPEPSVFLTSATPRRQPTPTATTKKT